MNTIRKNILIGRMLVSRCSHFWWARRRLDSINRVFFRKLGQEATSHLAKDIGALRMVSFWQKWLNRDTNDTFFYLLYFDAANHHIKRWDQSSDTISYFAEATYMVGRSPLPIDHFLSWRHQTFCQSMQAPGSQVQQWVLPLELPPKLHRLLSLPLKYS